MEYREQNSKSDEIAKIRVANGKHGRINDTKL
jgi:hypothetical protein